MSSVNLLFAHLKELTIHHDKCTNFKRGHLFEQIPKLCTHISINIHFNNATHLKLLFVSMMNALKKIDIYYLEVSFVRTGNCARAQETPTSSSWRAMCEKNGHDVLCVKKWVMICYVWKMGERLEEEKLSMRVRACRGICACRIVWVHMWFAMWKWGTHLSSSQEVFACVFLCVCVSVFICVRVRDLLLGEY